MATRVYGHSDDLIEIDGDITGEFGCYGSGSANEPNGAVVFDDGTVTEWTYDGDGVWRCKVLAKGRAFGRVDVCDGSDTDKDYSDILYLGEGVNRAWGATGALERVS